MKRKLFVVAVILLLSTLIFNVKVASAASRPTVDWAVIIAGTNEVLGRWGSNLPSNLALHDSYYMYYVLTSDLGVPKDNIKFLHPNPGSVFWEIPDDVWALLVQCTKEMVNWALSSWLGSHSTSSDNVLIYVCTHGTTRFDYSGDEADGLDEAFVFSDYLTYYEEYYSDDDLSDALKNVEFNEMTIVLQNCFSGGFIDDLRGEGRRIITASAETKTAASDLDFDGFSEFSAHFIDALHGYNTEWNDGTAENRNNRIADVNPITAPDYNNDGVVSWKEAYTYAKGEYPYDDPCYCCPPNTPSKPSGRTSGYWGTYYSYSTKTTDPDGDEVRYKFDWDDGSYTYTGYYSSGVNVSRSHKWSVTGYKHVRVRACDEYGKWSGWSSNLTVYIRSGGDSGGCPVLSVYDGTEYVEEGLLDIHNPEGVDVVYEHSLTGTPQRVDGAYLLRLTEHPKTHSYTDQVKLYAVLEDGTLKELPLIWAWHSEDGNVLPMLLHSDEWKADTLGADHNEGTSQSIDLKFAALSPNLEITGFVFQIEGNNILPK